MKIFCDRHHQSLWESLQLLFEKRLGHELFHPYGMDWFPEHWALARPYGDNIDTAKQFLASGVPTDGTAVINPTRGISFDDFKKTPFDIIIASYYPHIEIYERLRQRYQPQAKLIAQYGNEWPIHPLCKNLLSSTAPFQIPSNINACWYHQEINQAVFKPYNAFPSRRITSFSNAMPLNDLFKQDWQDFLQLESLLPDFEMKSFGGGCRNGSLSQEDVAKEMNNSQWIVHFKKGGDGFGHVLHSAFACGVPVIYKGSQYKGKLGGELLIHLETGIDIEAMGLQTAADYLRSLSIDAMMDYRKRVLEKFRQKVNYNKEEEEIRGFLQKLL